MRLLRPPQLILVSSDHFSRNKCFMSTSATKHLLHNTSAQDMALLYVPADNRGGGRAVPHPPNVVLDKQLK